MKKCTVCNELTDDQFLNKYTRTEKINNSRITTSINVCDYCDLDEAYCDDNHDTILYIDHNSKKYVRHI